MAAGQAFDRLVQIIRTLRGPEGCPWDREQTHHSLRPFVLEEAHEVIEAIDALAAEAPGSGHKLREELGDLLLQVVLHAEIAREEGRFDATEVVAALCEKMVRRHPHVFGDASAASSEEVLRHWERIKAEEKRDRGEGTHGSLLDGIPAGVPALMRALAVQKRASRVGFDWDTPEEALTKVWEEAREVRRARQEGDKGRLEEEMGDLFFALTNVSRLLAINPELALAGAVRRFENRFRHMEAAAAGAGHRLEDLSLEELDELWETGKRQEGRRESGR